MVTAEDLSRWSFFAGLTDEMLARLAFLARIQNFDAGATVFRAGGPAEALYLLTAGWVDIVAQQDEPSDLLTAITAGDIFGWSALVAPYIYTAAARCATPAVALALPGADLRALFETDAALCYALMNRLCSVIAGRLSATRSQLVATYIAR